MCLNKSNGIKLLIFIIILVVIIIFFIFIDLILFYLIFEIKFEINSYFFYNYLLEKESRAIKCWVLYNNVYIINFISIIRVYF